MTRITISLKEQEKLALRALAEKESRDPRAQAALIIRHELQRLGLLAIENQADDSPMSIKSIDNLKQGGNHVIE